METRTPMRVRGKRTATPAERWHHGKQRQTVKPRLLSKRSSSMLSDSSTNRSSRKRKRKPYNPELSRLEQLPSEVVQLIFVYSANANLPLASAGLGSQLASRHLYHEITDKLLQPVLGCCDPSVEALNGAMRLMNSRFFTLQFFKDWLDSQRKSRDLDKLAPDEDLSREVSDNNLRVWRALRPHWDVLPPTKLMRAPFTLDKVAFLGMFEATMQITGRSRAINPIWHETAIVGLQEAIMEQAESAVDFFLRAEVQIDTALLRRAVVDADCNQRIVGTMLDHSAPEKGRAGEEADVDYLDLALWAWADKASQRGDSRGAWLRGLLKTYARKMNVQRGKLAEDDEKAVSDDEETTDEDMGRR